MAKVRVKDEKSLEEAKEKLRGTVDFRKTKCGVIAAKSKSPKKKIYGAKKIKKGFITKTK